MNGRFDHELNERLAALREEDLFRQLRRVDTPQSPRIRIDGKTLLNFSSNDYLGLANQAEIKEAAMKAVERYGAGSGASRLICGSLSPHHGLEESLAAFKGTEAALSFSSGYATALGAIGALLGRGDIIVLDRLVHACIVDAARLCGAKLRVFAHNDLDNLETVLRWAAGKHPKARVLIVTESIFSMDGDAAPLREIATLKERYGAWWMVDEAHATGVYGPNRRGLADELGVSSRIEIQMGTLGKALGASGGFIAGSRTLIDFLINRARSFIFSTAPVPAAAAAANAAVAFVQSTSGEDRCRLLWQRVAEVPAWRPAGLGGDEARAGSSTHVRSAIIPLIVGGEAESLKAADALRERGIFVPAIRYPTVARGQARLRVTVTASHSTEDVRQLAAGLEELSWIRGT